MGMPAMGMGMAPMQPMQPMQMQGFQQADGFGVGLLSPWGNRSEVAIVLTTWLDLLRHDTHFWPGKFFGSSCTVAVAMEDWMGVSCHQLLLK